MRLLLDVHHSRIAAERLRAAGHDVVAVADDRVLARLDDEELLRAAARDGRAVVTENVADLERIARAWATTGVHHAGVVFTSPPRFHRGSAAYPANLRSRSGRSSMTLPSRSTPGSIARPERRHQPPGKNSSSNRARRPRDVRADLPPAAPGTVGHSGTAHVEWRLPGAPVSPRPQRRACPGLLDRSPPGIGADTRVIIWVVALTVRTDDQMEEALDALVELEGVSRQEVIRRSVVDRYQRTVHRRGVV